ncbi:MULTISPECIES: ATP-binding cassette domain-containing protein [unclassified Corynebacterium]|uniref:ATP-binding cassette domain-containing protein n=1 Tax=unclassified Corynebacterium TaxID=2624378 RepID=UPI0029C9DE0A|nr:MULTISPECIES: ATP-binding cassette domain-containing protein [unclassified Corynebacterium]WPF66593.1 ATP-binding cassette domain-containing protein [Corynebacterium sp. 22KM0430]WPF69081.1 ATP-binding cassette domain-containing protein [Corynebacterium sp. 21KM1197]
MKIHQAVDRRGFLAPTTWELEPGVHGLIGPNGSGKTTLLRTIAGLTPLRSGSRDVSAAAMSMTGNDISFAGERLYHHFSAAALVHPEFDHALAERLLEPLDLTPHSSTRKLSVGGRQLAAVSTTLASRAPLMLLDEPFTGLDVTAREGLRAALLGLIQGSPLLTIIITSHRAEDLAGLVEDATPIHRGHLGGTYSLDDLRARFPILSGPTTEVRQAAGSLPVLREQTLGNLTRLTLSGTPAHVPHGVTVEYPEDAAAIDTLVYQERNRS